MELKHQMQERLKRLKLPGIANNLELRLKEARENRLGHLDFLSLLIQDELLNRESNNMEKRIKQAGFGMEKTFEGYDFHFNEAALPSATVRDLAACHFIEQKQNLVLAGPSGIGKTHIVKAIGHELCRRGGDVFFRKTHKLLNELLTAPTPRYFERLFKKFVKADLLILDDFAFRKFDQKESEYLYAIADERITRGTTILTSNRPPQDWYSVFPDPLIGQAIIDRLVSGAIKIITNKGKSYRKNGGINLSDKNIDMT